MPGRAQAHVTIMGDQVTTNEIAGNLVVEHMMAAGQNVMARRLEEGSYVTGRSETARSLVEVVLTRKVMSKLHSSVSIAVGRVTRRPNVHQSRCMFLKRPMRKAVRRSNLLLRSRMANALVGSS